MRVAVLSTACLIGIACAGNGGMLTGAGGAGGTTGSAGTTGHAGTTGSAGTTGVAGTMGSAGTTGVAGTTGSAGTTGTAGTTGGAGTTGVAGATGTGGRGGTGGGAGTGGGSAGASGSGGTGGAAGTGGSVVVNPCSARTGLLFCDDFEARTSLTAPWMIQGTANITIDATVAHSGTKSVHVHSTDTDFDTLFALHDSSILPAPGGRFYFRAFMRLSRAMAAGHNTYIIGDLFSTPGSGNNLRLGEMNAMLMYTVAGDAHGALSNQNFYNDGKAGVVFTPSTWVCLEVLLDHAKPEIDVWVDATEVPDLHHTDFPVDSYDVLRFGFEKYAGPALDIWYDDIAVGTARIGCN